VAEVRIAGLDRYATAATVAQASTTANNANIILVSGENFPDGLAAAGLSGAAGAPILLTMADSLPSVTANALAIIFGSAATKTVHIIGGVDAVSAEVAAQVTALGYTVNRVSGADRYATAAAIATLQASLVTIGSSSVAGVSYKTAIVATGTNFKDALAAGTLANNLKVPILLTKTDELPAATSTSLTTLGIGRVIIMGGTSAVSQEVEDAIKALGTGIVVTRVAGADAGATAAAFADLLVAPIASGGFNLFATGAGTTCLGTATGPNMVLLVSGDQYADAMVSAPQAGICKAPILFAGSAASATFVTTNAAKVGLIKTIGGTAAVSAEDATAVKTSATTATPTGKVTAEVGNDVLTVEFSEKMAVGTPVVKVNNGIIPCVVTAVPVMPTVALTDGVCQLVTTATGTTSTLVIDTANNVLAGDKINVSGLTSTASGNTMAPAETTAVAATAAPTLTVSGATIGSTSITLTYSRPVAAIADAKITVTGGTVTVGSGLDVSAGRGTTWTVTTSTLVAGQTVTVGTTTATATGGAPNQLAAAVTTVVAAAGAAPKATAAVGAVVETGGVLQTDNVPATNVIVQAKSARDTGGVAGSLSVVLADPGTATASTTAASATNATTGVITITVTLAHSGAAVTATSSDVAAALNAGVGTLVTAFASDPLSNTIQAGILAQDVPAGTRTLNVAVTFDKALGVTLGNANLSGYDANGDTFSEVTGTSATPVDLAAGKIKVSFVLGVGAAAKAAPTAASALRLAGANVADTSAQANAGQAILITS